MKPSSIALFRQYLAAATASISVIILGTTLAWPSPVLTKIEETNEPMSLTTSEISWMVSFLYLGNLMSPMPAGMLMDRLGRKRSLSILSVIPLTSWTIIYFANASYMLYIARFLSGMWSGIVTTIAPMYLAEISEPRIRGALSTFVQLMINLGVVFEYIVGPSVSYHLLAVISGAIPLIFVVTFWFIPESPYWLVMVGKKDEACRSLAWLRGYNSPDCVKEEMEIIEKNVIKEMCNKHTMKDLIATSGNRKALIIVEMLAILQRMSGISALIAYTSTTLPPQGAGMLGRNDCVIVMGMVWVASVFIAMVLVDSWGRKPLLFGSSVGCGLAMFTAGLWFFLDTETDINVQPIYWLPFCSLLVYGLCFSIGLGPIPSTVQGEAFPTNIKGLASGLTAVVTAGTSFIMNKIYHPLAEGVGMYINYWVFSCACAVATIFVITYVVETKGKTLHEIQEKLNHKKITVNSNGTRSTPDIITNSV
ncbi:facilitated trehalose transporter Tret1-like [Cimex lectularius]|uniref:Major facilitator superfamily (MFS) profile domain-containing protein n=1 Tax=Cimex lectularius TaxID=79782 RepID=A0A8I6TK56_CIMLE|nr:facilitated trehalose transporter Tret1-like [Cimex lectularius]